MGVCCYRLYIDFWGVFIMAAGAGGATLVVGMVSRVEEEKVLGAASAYANGK